MHLFFSGSSRQPAHTTSRLQKRHRSEARTPQPLDYRQTPAIEVTPSQDTFDATNSPDSIFSFENGPNSGSANLPAPEKLQAAFEKHLLSHQNHEFKDSPITRSNTQREAFRKELQGDTDAQERLERLDDAIAATVAELELEQALAKSETDAKKASEDPGSTSPYHHRGWEGGLSIPVQSKPFSIVDGMLQMQNGLSIIPTPFSPVEDTDGRSRIKRSHSVTSTIGKAVDVATSIKRNLSVHKKPE